MRGDDGKRFFIIKEFQKTLSQRASQLGIGAGTKFVDEQKRVRIGLADDSRHLFQPRRVGGKVVFDGLIVANVRHDFVEEKHLRFWMRRHQNPALDHELKQPDGFQSDRFPPGVRPGNTDDAVVLRKGERLRIDFFVFGAVAQPEERVVGIFQPQGFVAVDFW